jgi:glycine cleavage system H protein
MEVLGTKVLPGLKYSKTSEWAKVEGDKVRVGLTDYAQHELTDIVFVELPKIGAKTKQAESMATVESVKAAADFYAPITGEVVEVNKKLEDQPELLNKDPFGEGWMVIIKLSNKKDLDNLMDPDAYIKHIEAEHHSH